MSGWSFRLVKEEAVSASSYFITLTYNTDHVPITKNGFMSLQPRDVQLYFKRLRKVHTNKIRYFIVGEYGGRTNRPHYHAIMFNVDILQVEKLWHYGDIHCGQVSEASIGYTLKYMMKKGKIPLHKNDDRVPEFQRMSKGLGKNYLTKEMYDWHKADLENRMYCPLQDGQKIAMPRYYKDKLYTPVEKRQIGDHLSKLKDEVDLTGQQEMNRALYYEQKKSRSRLIESL